jgi:hypothetical protein
MHELRERVVFELEKPSDVRVRSVARKQPLESDVATSHWVVYVVDHCHSAPTQYSLNAIALGNQAGVLSWRAWF